MLFINYSLEFNTIIPDILVDKLTNLAFPPSICAWIKNFLTDHSQTVKVGSTCSSTLTLSTGSPQGCVLRPLLYSLYTYDCTPIRPSNTIIKFADDTTVIGLISGGDETEYRDEINRLAGWCCEHNLLLITRKTKEMVIDFRKQKGEPAPLSINVWVSSYKFLCTYIADDLSWTANSSAVVKKARQRLHFLMILRRNHLEEKLLVAFYRSTIESVLSYGITAWYANCKEADRKSLQRVINSAQHIIGSPLPSLEELGQTLLTSHTQDSTCSTSCALAEGTGALRAGQTDSNTVFFNYYGGICTILCVG